MATDDFSFPIFTDPFSCSIDSPPLWCLSPAASPDPYHDEERSTQGGESSDDDDQEEDYKDCFPTESPLYKNRRKSFPGIEEVTALSKTLVKRIGSRNDKEEKMDMLWEDFNTEETLTRSHSSGSKLDSDQTINMGCVEALRLSEPNGVATIFSPRKPSLIVFVNVLKRLFLLHNSRRSVKHHSSLRPSAKVHRSHSHKPAVKK